VPAPADGEPAPRPPPKPEVIANRWVRLDPPATPYVLGVADKAPPEQVGFRAVRRIRTPLRPYELQEHEVTWSELEAWLAGASARVEYRPWATDAGQRARLPATGVTWPLARDYCRSLGSALPTEEEWEYAARGPERRPNPWGADPLDRQMTRVYAGPDAAPSPVMTNQQDRTKPAAGGLPIWDLAGNVQEWTLGLWRGDWPGEDESDVQRGETSVRAVRGLPLAEAPPDAIQPDAAAYRERLCATGPCVEKTRKILASVGFRCAKSLDK
jgi:serine/threonine-protein kinase